MFIKPIPNYEANNYTELISSFWFEPPYTCCLTDEELGHFEDTPLSLHLPSNSVQTEHMTEVADQSTSADERDGMIRAIEKDCSEKPKVETRADLTFNA